ncbi:UNVERIFIED_CONTAM: hypothetical protein Sradi_0279900 [Sesamum radiatum]|uniref:Endonuclease/exonuclease/phosphatase domain-containing protein n=1 Tax=Sesamum radiatum TaxID=300843 RepID=A0AAW2W6H5_SESRA
MSLLVWNCRGLGGSWTVQTLGSLIRVNNPSLVFLTKTKCTSRRIENLKRQLDMNGFSVPARGMSGGLAVLWLKSANVQLQTYSQNHIDLSVQLEGSPSCWRFTGLYGEPEASRRDLTWQLLARLHSQSQRAWLCAGDFNEILDQSEKLGGPPRPNWQIRNFRNALSVCGLTDVGYRGSQFTWSNRQPYPQTVQERLDRACANFDWSRIFPEASVSHLHVNCSDHKALLIQLADRPVTSHRMVRPWRFEAAWLQSEQCEKVIADSWVVGSGSGCINGVAPQISFCQSNLTKWSKTVFQADKRRGVSRSKAGTVDGAGGLDFGDFPN